MRCLNDMLMNPLAWDAASESITNCIACPHVVTALHIALNAPE